MSFKHNNSLTRLKNRDACPTLKRNEQHTSGQYSGVTLLVDRVVVTVATG